MSEVLVHRPGFVDASLLHDQEAQAVHDAVALVAMSLEVGESFQLFLRRRVVHLTEQAGMELPADLHREVMPDTRIAMPPLAHEGDGLGDDVVVVTGSRRAAAHGAPRGSR
jgi:hypothetical protein